jgi:hypothetical protein
MSIIIILAIIGLCVICNKLSKFFTRLGKLLEQVSDKATKYSYHKECIRSVEATHNKALRQAKNKITDADYKNRIRAEIDALTK